MATIGQQLLVPEVGTQRIEQSDVNITKVGSWTTMSDGNASGGSAIYNNSAGSIKFNFTGSVLRIIVYLAYIYEANVKISIDGVVLPVFSCNLATNTPNVFKVMAFEKTDLSNGEHSVIITNPGSNYMNIDAIDIVDTGIVKPYNIFRDRIKTSIGDMQIGDAISCRYTALSSGKIGYFSEFGTCTAAEIPVTGTALPNGKFYLVFAGFDTKGRIKLISDRNLQTAISWDTINTEGIASGEGIKILEYEDTIPVMTSNTNGNIIISSSGVYNATYADWRMFNKTATDAGDSWVCADGQWDNAWVKVDYGVGNEKKISKYKVVGRNYDPAMAPTGWVLEGSNDDVNWLPLHVATAQSITQTVSKTYMCDTNTGIPFRYVRIRVTSSPSTYCGFGELILYKKNEQFSSYNLSTRLLTGGTSTADLDNEWDKIIVSSTLNSKISAGDNGIWNWSGMVSWTSTTGTSAGNRITRGNTLVTNTNAPTGLITNTANATTAFRPIILIEVMMILKFLIQDGTLLKTINAGNLDTVGNATDIGTLIETAFITSGMNDLSSWVSSLMDQITTKPPKVAIYKKS